MAKRGVATYAIDVRGFGSWMKAEGHEEVDFQACLNDVKTALETIHAAHPGLKVFLLGESMGGAIALRAASMYPQLIDGLISSRFPPAIALNRGEPISKWLCDS